MTGYPSTGDKYCILCYNYKIRLHSSQEHFTSQSKQIEEISQDLIRICSKHLPSEIITSVNWRGTLAQDLCLECQINTKKLSRLNSQLEILSKEICELVDLVTQNVRTNRKNYLERNVTNGIDNVCVAAANPGSVQDVHTWESDGDDLGSPNNVDEYEEIIPVVIQNSSNELSKPTSTIAERPVVKLINKNRNEKSSSKRSATQNELPPEITQEFFQQSEVESNTVKSSDLLPHLDNPDGFECSSCHKVFSRLAILQRHNCEKPTHECSTCGKSFSTGFVLKQHSLCHSGEQPFKCETCGKGFSIKHNLIRHIRIHTGEKPFTCEFCKKSFSDETGFARHTRTHTDNNDINKVKYKCDICSKQLSDLEGLKKHLRRHISYKKCEICQRSFRTAERLEKHKLTHRRRDVHECEICEKKLSCISSLKVHLLTHNGEKSNKCPVCEKAFRHLGALKRHQTMHEISKEETFICEKCGKIFHNQLRHKLHLKNHRDKVFACEICQDKKFSTKQQLDVHRIAVHTTEKPFVCEACGKTFKSQDRLSRHKTIHLPQTSKIFCEVCHKVFKSTPALSNHQQKNCNSLPVKQSVDPMTSKLKKQQENKQDKKCLPSPKRSVRAAVSVSNNSHKYKDSSTDEESSNSFCENVDAVKVEVETDSDDDETVDFSDSNYDFDIKIKRE